MHNSSAKIYLGAKTLIFIFINLFFIPTWCENKRIKTNNMLFGEFNGKY